MTHHPRLFCVAALLVSTCAGVGAQPAPAAEPVAAPSVAAPVTPAPTAAEATVQDEKSVGTSEPRVQVTVVEDGNARIDELKVRGQTQRIVITPSRGAQYQVITPSDGRDLTWGPHDARGAAGQRVWNMFSF